MYADISIAFRDRFHVVYISEEKKSRSDARESEKKRAERSCTVTECLQSLNKENSLFRAVPLAIETRPMR